MTSEYRFTLLIDGDINDESVINSLFEHGCGDATFAIIDNVTSADFCREADSFPDAVLSAIDDVESVAGLRVHTILADEPAS